MNDELNKIIAYINKNYDVKAIKKERFLYKNNVYIAAKKYDLNIGIDKPESNERHFLSGKTKYYLAFDAEANKKYRSKLCWHGTGYHDKYNENDYSNINEFLERFGCQKKDKEQLTIFDLINN